MAQKLTLHIARTSIMVTVLALYPAVIFAAICGPNATVAPDPNRNWSIVGVENGVSCTPDPSSDAFKTAVQAVAEHNREVSQNTQNEPPNPVRPTCGVGAVLSRGADGTISGQDWISATARDTCSPTDTQIAKYDADQTGTGATKSDFVPLAEYGNSPKFKQAFEADGIAPYFNALFGIILSVGAMITVMRIIWAGYLYMGSDMWSKKEVAKKMFIDAIVGLLILFGIYLILFQINPDLLNIDKVFKDLQTAKT